MNEAFKIQELALPGVLLLTPRVLRDSRGFFVETYNERTLAPFGIRDRFVQDSLSHSAKGVLRGLHMQRAPHGQIKLVRCAAGEIFDVAADCDPNSKTYGKHTATRLKSKEATMLYIPAKYHHGFCVISEEATVEYKVGDFYAPESATGIRFDDPVLNIPWPVTDPILSDQDKSWPFLHGKK